jgi:hypothetical protein
MGKRDTPDGVDTYPADQHDLDSYRQLDAAMTRLQVPVLLHAGNPHERLYIAALDGTGNSLFKDAPGKRSVVAKMHLQIDALQKQGVTNIAGGYVEGTFTQNDPIARGRDGVTGFTFDRRVETAYLQFCEQAKKWIDEDPKAQIRIVGVGFSRGAEEVAALTQLVDDRGIQDPEDASITRDKEGLVTRIAYTKLPLIPPGKTLQAVLLYDPVATGLKDEDRRLSKSVVSGLQLTAEDERRDQFTSTNQLQPGFSEGNRFLNQTVGASHSNMGDTYVLNGLGVRSFNAGVDYINALSDRPILHKRALPEDPSFNVVHRSDQHLGRAYTSFGYRADGRRDRHNDLAPQALCDLQIERDCARKEPIDPALDRLLERRGVGIGPVPPGRKTPGRDEDNALDVEPARPKQDTAAPAPKSFLDTIIDRLSQGALDKDDAMMKSAVADYMRSPMGEQFQREVGQQQMQAREQQAAVEAQQQLLAQQQTIANPHVMRM